MAIRLCALYGLLTSPGTFSFARRTRSMQRRCCSVHGYFTGSALLVSSKRLCFKHFFPAWFPSLQLGSGESSIGAIGFFSTIGRIVEIEYCHHLGSKMVVKHGGIWQYMNSNHISLISLFVGLRESI